MIAHGKEVKLLKNSFYSVCGGERLLDVKKGEPLKFCKYNISHGLLVVHSKVFHTASV